MDFNKIVAISNMSGLYEIMAQRPNGLFVRNLDNNRTIFASNRVHNFSPLDKISIYTTDGAANMVALEEVLRTIILRQIDTDNSLPLPTNQSTPATMREYFYQILPTHDPDRVHIGDIKKMVRWANLLQQHNAISLDTTTSDEATATEAAADTNEQATA